MSKSLCPKVVIVMKTHNVSINTDVRETKLTYGTVFPDRLDIREFQCTGFRPFVIKGF